MYQQALRCKGWGWQPFVTAPAFQPHEALRTRVKSRRRALQLLGGWASAAALPLVWAAEIWIKGTTRGRSAVFATEALSNLPEASARAALPRMVQVLWTFDAASVPDAKELRRVQDRVWAEAQAQVKSVGAVRLVATGRAPEGAFWCFYAPEKFKVSALAEALAGFDSTDQALAARLRNRLSWVERLDPKWTWIEALLREMAR